MQKAKTCIALLVAFFISSCASNDKPLDCKKFRNGTFKSTYQGRNMIIKRAGDRQEETLDGAKRPSIFIITWVDDCTYTLKPTATIFEDYPSLDKKALFTVRIVRTTANSYFIKMSSNYDNTIVETEITRTD
jgi:hypothetical protein